LPHLHSFPTRRSSDLSTSVPRMLEVGMGQQGIVQLLKDPVAQELLNSNIPARFVYIGLDGSPRVIPIWFHWDGQRFVLGTGDNSDRKSTRLNSSHLGI